MSSPSFARFQPSRIEARRLQLGSQRSLCFEETILGSEHGRQGAFDVGFRGCGALDVPADVQVEAVLGDFVVVDEPKAQTAVTVNVEALFVSGVDALDVLIR